jgi:hypothetical protein
MEISTFELLVKPIGPRSNPALATVARRVIQGYFLTITNLEDRSFEYRLEFHVSRSPSADPNRSLAGKAAVFFDIAGENELLTLTPVMGGSSTPVFTTQFTLPAKQTASVQLLPDIRQPELLNESDPQLEIRGFVRLRLPTIGRGMRRRAQSDRPVKVLLNPEIRGTFVPNTFPRSGGDFDQINYPLELASGKGLNEVVPDFALVTLDPGIIPDLMLDRPLPDLVNPPMIDLSVLSPAARAEVLAETLAQVDPSAENLSTVSDLLSKLEIPIRMEPVNR